MTLFLSRANTHGNTFLLDYIYAHTIIQMVSISFNPLAGVYAALALSNLPRAGGSGATAISVETLGDPSFSP